MSCLRDKAVQYIYTTSHMVRRDYHLLVEALERRYGQTEMPTAIRRELNCLRQTEEEILEDFADRVLTRTYDGFPASGESEVQSLALDYFLRGCKDRAAALVAMNRDPVDLPSALQFVKSAIQNTKAMNVQRYSGRQVTFETGPESTSWAESPVRQVKSPDPLKHMEGMFQSLAENMSKSIQKSISETLSLDLQQLITSNDKLREKLEQQSREARLADEKRNSRPPGSPKGLCFNCQSPNHFFRECTLPRKSSPSSLRSHSPEVRPGSSMEPRRNLNSPELK